MNSMGHMHESFLEYMDVYIYNYIYNDRYMRYTVTTFKYVEGGPDRKAPEVVWNTSSYILM